MKEEEEGAERPQEEEGEGGAAKEPENPSTVQVSPNRVAPNRVSPNRVSPNLPSTSPQSLPTSMDAIATLIFSRSLSIPPPLTRRDEDDGGREGRAEVM